MRRQEKPFRPLAEAARSQSEWTHQNASGTLVGIRCPRWVGGMNVPGYHWHFLSDDHKLGGHVLDCKVDAGQVSFDVCGEWVIELDGSPELDQIDLGQDLSRDLRRVEGARGDESPPAAGPDRQAGPSPGPRP